MRSLAQSPGPHLRQSGDGRGILLRGQSASPTIMSGNDAKPLGKSCKTHDVTAPKRHVRSGCRTGRQTQHRRRLSRRGRSAGARGLSASSCEISGCPDFKGESGGQGRGHLPEVQLRRRQADHHLHHRRGRRRPRQPVHRRAPALFLREPDAAAAPAARLLGRSGGDPGRAAPPLLPAALFRAGGPAVQPGGQPARLPSGAVAGREAVRPPRPAHADVRPAEGDGAGVGRAGALRRGAGPRRGGRPAGGGGGAPARGARPAGHPRLRRGAGALPRLARQGQGAAALPPRGRGGGGEPPPARPDAGGDGGRAGAGARADRLRARPGGGAA